MSIFGLYAQYYDLLYAEKNYAKDIDYVLGFLRRYARGAGAAPDFRRGDIRDFDLGKQFDVVVALFHVMSYLPSDRDLKLTVSNVSRHLKPGGLFLFDFWYGPAVLADPPARRVKTLENDEIGVTRIATPTLHTGNHLVDVNYP